MTWSDLKPGYEAVFTVIEYYDGPRRGIANFQRLPHLYDCIFDQAKDEYSHIFSLTPVSDELFSLAIEDWEIWKRWEAAFYSGKTDLSSHPALSNDRARHEEIAEKLRGLVTDPTRSVRKTAHFEVLGRRDLPKGVIRSMQVKWNDP